MLYAALWIAAFYFMGSLGPAGVLMLFFGIILLANVSK